MNEDEDAPRNVVANWRRLAWLPYKGHDRERAVPVIVADTVGRSRPEGAVPDCRAAILSANRAGLIRSQGRNPAAPAATGDGQSTRSP
jgi:hypothetical protein